jgi:hypothetical protein
MKAFMLLLCGVHASPAVQPSLTAKMPIHLYNITHDLVHNMTDDGGFDDMLYGPAPEMCQNEVENLRFRVLILWVVVICFVFSSLCMSISHCVFIGRFRRLQRRLDGQNDEKAANAATDASPDKPKSQSLFSRMCSRSRKDSPYDLDREAEIRRYTTRREANGMRSSLTLSV